jgi:hypothetical protein
MDDIFETSQPSNGSESHGTPQVEKPVEYQETPEQLHELANQLSDEELKQRGVDDPKSFRYWNSKYDKEVNPLKTKVQELSQRLQEKEAKFSEFENIVNVIKNPVQKEEPLVKPQKPTDDDPVAKLNYLETLADYNEKVNQKQASEFTKFVETQKQKEQAQAETLKQAQYKAYVAGKLQTVGGLKPEEALEAINIYSKAQSNEDEYFGDLSEFYKYKKNKGLVNKIKTEQPDQPLPPGIKSGANVPTEDETKNFMGSINTRKDIGLFETK